MKLLNTMLLAAGLGFLAQTQLHALTINDGFYVGRIVDGAPPSDFVSMINTLTSFGAGTSGPSGTETYYRSGLAGPFGTAISTGFQEFNPDDLASTSATGYEFIWAKYGGYVDVWYNATGFTGIQTLPGAPPSDELSHFRLVNALAPTTHGVPDGGTTAVLLGISLIGVGYATRRFKVATTQF